MPTNPLSPSSPEINSGSPSRGADEELTELTDALDAFAKAVGNCEYNPYDDDYQDALYKTRTAIESLFSRIREERDRANAEIIRRAEHHAREYELHEATKAELGRIREAAQADKERLDWLDTKGRFFVALNRHDGRQSGVDESGIPVIYRLWLKDRGGENQSLRDALDELRPTTEAMSALRQISGSLPEKQEQTK